MYEIEVFCENREQFKKEINKYIHLFLDNLLFSKPTTKLGKIINDPKQDYINDIFRNWTTFCFYPLISIELI